MTPDEKHAGVERLKPWFHRIDLGDGVVTKTASVAGEPVDHPLPTWAEIARVLPDDLSGKSVLDVGCNAGFYAVEAKRRGAARVLGVDSQRHQVRQASFVARALGLPIEFRRMSVYDLSPETVGIFDVTLALGLVYHLKHLVQGLERLYSVTGELLILETAVLLPALVPTMAVPYVTGPLERSLHPIGYVANSPDAKEAVYNWFVPSVGAIGAMLSDTGFADVQCVATPGDRAVFVCRKGRGEPSPGPPGPRRAPVARLGARSAAGPGEGVTLTVRASNAGRSPWRTRGRGRGPGSGRDRRSPLPGRRGGRLALGSRGPAGRRRGRRLGGPSPGGRGARSEPGATASRSTSWRSTWRGSRTSARSSSRSGSRFSASRRRCRGTAWPASRKVLHRAERPELPTARTPTSFGRRRKRSRRTHPTRRPGPSSPGPRAGGRSRAAVDDLAGPLSSGAATVAGALHALAGRPDRRWVPPAPPVEVCVALSARAPAAPPSAIPLSGESFPGEAGVARGLLAEGASVNDEDFVHRAYAVILGRPADEEGLANACEQLSSGAMTRTHLLHELLWSEELRQGLMARRPAMTRSPIRSEARGRRPSRSSARRARGGRRSSASHARPGHLGVGRAPLRLGGPGRARRPRQPSSATRLPAVRPSRAAARPARGAALRRDAGRRRRRGSRVGRPAHGPRAGAGSWARRSRSGQGFSGRAFRRSGSTPSGRSPTPPAAAAFFLAVLLLVRAERAANGRGLDRLRRSRWVRQPQFVRRSRSLSFPSRSWSCSVRCERRTAVRGAAWAAGAGLAAGLLPYVPIVVGSGGLHSFLAAARVAADYVRIADSPPLRNLLTAGLWSRWLVDPFGGPIPSAAVWLAAAGIVLRPGRFASSRSLSCRSSSSRSPRSIRPRRRGTPSRSWPRPLSRPPSA